MKRKISLIFILVLLVSILSIGTFSVTANAATLVNAGTCGDNLTWTLDDEGTLKIYGAGTMKNYTSSSAAPWYSLKSSITKVEIDQGVTSIGNYAFYGCSNLTSITISDSVTSIGSSAFYDCSNLTSVVIPSNVKYINESTFRGCSSLVSVTMPDSVSSIGASAFYNCSSLASIEIPNSVTSIGSSAFYGCSSLTYNVKDDLKYLGNSSNLYLYLAGPESTSITVATVDNNCKIIREAALSGCNNLIEIVLPFLGNSANASYPYPLGYIFGTTAYTGATATKQTYNTSGSGSTSTTTYYIPDSLKEVHVTGGRNIPRGAFQNCSNLTSVVIGDSVTSIGSSAFSGCSSLKSITLPFVGDRAVKSTDTYKYPFGYIFGGTSYAGGVKTKQVYYYSTSSKTSAEYYIPSSLKSVTITGGQHIPYGAFYNCSNLTSITISDSVTSIDLSAFENCSGLKEITLPFVGYSAYASSSYSNFGYIFGACDESGFAGLSGYERNSEFVPYSLKKVIITSANTISSNAFYGCSYITSVEFPNSVTSIESWAFYGCRSLTNIVIPNNVKSIGKWAFSYCYSLTNVVISDSVTSIGDYAFAACPSSLTIYAHANTYAETYAKSEGLVFEYLHEYDDDCDEICNFCGFIRNAPHELEWVIDKPNNCSIDGTKHGVCNVCQAVLYENTVIPATGEHTLLTINDKKCSVCEKEVILVQYDYNDGATEIKIWLKPNESTTIPSEAPVRSGYNFVGWSTTKDGDVKYQAGDTLSSLSKSIILYAQWNKRCTSCGGDGLMSSSCSYCHGSGVYTDDCGSCNGEGGRYVFSSTCTKCSGSGAQCGSCGRGLSALSGKCSYCGSNTVTYCKSCGGSGGDKQWRTCTSCSGSGRKTYTCNSCPSSYKCTNCNGTGEVIRTSVSAPSVPSVELIECDTIILNAIMNGEYSIDGINWQDSPIFTNLKPETQYIVYQRYAKTDTTYRSEGTVILISTSKHLYDYICDDDCNYCGEIRTISHTYDSDCDKKCNICFEERETGVKHIYDNACDEACNYCHEIRTISHSYDSECDNECNVCFNVRVTSIEHIYDNVCDANCNQCGEIRKAPHDYKWIIDAQNNCGVTGLKHEECLACGTTRNLNTTIDATNEHTEVVDKAVAATCTATGLTEGKHCSVCGKIFVAQEVVDAIGHNYKTVFAWLENHASCKITIECERDCDLHEEINCTVTQSEANQAQTVHTATAEYDGTGFTDILTCDNFLITFKDWDNTQISSTYYHIGNVVTVPVDPLRTSDNTYTYVFVGWDKSVVNCADNATYIATYDATYIDYTVTFKNEDGGILGSNTYHYGEAVVAPATPSKAANNTYTYTFAGWDSKVVACDGNRIYTAIYTPVYIDYTVVFKNHNGNTLSSKTYHYGDAVVVPADPTRAADDTYTYSFAGWGTSVATTCDGNKEYTATYTPTFINYTVEFKDYDGEVISTGTYHYGDAITVPTAPTRESDAIGSYTFKAWNNTVVNCAGDATYTATYEITYTDYTVIFKNEDGTVLSTETYHYGDAVTAPTTPTKAADNTYTYTFTCWDSEVVACNGDKVYTATYTPSYIEYTVVFKDHNGGAISTKTYHYGDEIAVPSNPVRTADNTYTYAFAGWDTSVVATCDGNKEYTATYTPTFIEYTIVFEDYNGTVLSTRSYHYGDPVTASAAPTRESDVVGSYTFKTWDNTVVNCVGDAVYTAIYDITYTDYTVIFKNEDSTVLSTDTYHYGDEVTAPEIPTKASDNTYTYTFKAWDAEVIVCTGDATYTATYDSAYIDYTVIFKNEDGTVLSTETYHYGDAVTAYTTPTKESDGEYTYTFNGWDKEIVACAGDAIYTATYTATEIENTTTTGTDTEPNEPGTDANDPSDNNTDENDGLSGGAIAGIATGSTVAAGAGGFSLFWFVIKKKRFSDLLKVFKKK